jgi:hypothetical protein
LRALRPAASRRRAAARVPAVPAAVLADHRELGHGLEELSTVADRLPDLDPAAALRAVRRARAFLVDELLPHELEEERTVYPVLAHRTPGEDPTPPLRRSHREIARRIRLFGRLVDELPAEDLEPDEILELQRALWSLHAVLELHVTLEDELYAGLRSTSPPSPPSAPDTSPAAAV